jgi:hypothetical protein
VSRPSSVSRHPSSSDSKSDSDSCCLFTTRKATRSARVSLEFYNSFLIPPHETDIIVRDLLHKPIVCELKFINNISRSGLTTLLDSGFYALLRWLLTARVFIRQYSKMMIKSSQVVARVY